jgi:hypothetical protein
VSQGIAETPGISGKDSAIGEILKRLKKVTL